MSKENKQTLGVRWLKFFCFWRPWISLSFSILFIMGLIGSDEYSYYYLNNIFGIITTVILISNSILLIILFFMAKKRNSMTVNFIKSILMLEVFVLAYPWALQTATSTINFFILFIIFGVIYYFLWYRTNMKYFKKRIKWFNNNLPSKKDIVLLEEDDIEKEDIVIENKSKIEKNIRYCKLCGGKIDNNKKCKKCGKQYFKLNKNTIMYLIIGILVISNLITLIMFVNKNNGMVENCDGHDSLCEIKIKRLTNGKSLDYVSDKLDFFDENIVFVIEGYGDYYYTYDCVQKITNGKNYSYMAFNIDGAINNGYIRGTCN